MIRFEPVPKPEGFATAVEQPGATWLVNNPAAKRPKDLWSPFKDILADGFRSLCAYSAMYEPVGTVDHFVSWHEDRSKAYEWENYRDRAEFVLHRLHLRDDERVLRQRREWYRMYQEHELSLESLRKKAPLIARAVERG